MELINNLPDFKTNISQEINLLAEEFKFRSFDPEALAKWLNLKVEEGGGWNSKENKLAIAIKACIVWGLGRGTNVRKTEKTLPKGLDKINKALKTLKIKDKGPMTEMKVTIGRLSACFPIMTARILMQMGADFNKISTSSKLPFYLMFPAALSLIDPDTDGQILQEFRVYARDFDLQINAGKASDQGKRSNFEKLILESKVVPKGQRKAVLEKLALELTAREAQMKKDREAAKRKIQEEAVKESGIKVEAAAAGDDDTQMLVIANEEKAEQGGATKKNASYLLPKGVKSGTETDFITAALGDKEIKQLISGNPKAEAIDAFRAMIKANAANGKKARKEGSLFPDESEIYKAFGLDFEGSRFFSPK